MANKALRKRDRFNADGPAAYAYRISSYIKCPRQVKAMTTREYGRAPELGSIEAMQAEHQRRKDAFAKEAYAEDYDPDNDNGEHYSPRRIITPEEKLARQRAGWAAKYSNEKYRHKVVGARPAPTVAKPIWPKWYRPLHRIPADMMLKRVADEFGVTAAALKGRGRGRVLTTPRSVFIRLMRDRGLSFPVIGRLLGNRDHSTIHNCFSKYAEYASTDERMETVYTELVQHNAS